MLQMKKMTIGVLVLILVVSLFAVDSLDLLTSKVHAEEAVEEGNTIEVNGTGKMTVEPDIAYLNVGVRTEDKDPSVAQERNKYDMDQIIKALEDFGIDSENLKTINYNIYQRYDYINENEREDYYVVENTLQITVNEIDQIGDIIDLASDNGANNINSLRFTVKDDSKYYQEALKTAMADAKGKAQAIMSTFDTSATLSKPYQVIEASNSTGIYYESPVMMDREEAVGAGMSTPIESGDIEISARVKVIYKY